MDAYNDTKTDAIILLENGLNSMHYNNFFNQYKDRFNTHILTDPIEAYNIIESHNGNIGLSILDFNKDIEKFYDYMSVIKAYNHNNPVGIVSESPHLRIFNPVFDFFHQKPVDPKYFKRQIDKHARVYDSIENRL